MSVPGWSAYMKGVGRPKGYRYSPQYFYNKRPEMFRSRGYGYAWCENAVVLLRAELKQMGVSRKHICLHELDNPLIHPDALLVLVGELRRSCASKESAKSGMSSRGVPPMRSAAKRAVQYAGAEAVFQPSRKNPVVEGDTA